MTKKANFRELNTTSRKTFTPKMDKLNGLNIVKLVGVNVEEFPYDESSKSPFAGMKGHRLTFHFEGVGYEGEAPYLGHSIFPFAPNSEAEEFYLEHDLRRVKHILEVVLDRKLEDKDFDILKADPLADDLTELELSDVLKLYTDFFKGVEKLLTNKGKVINSNQTYWLKLLPDNRNKKFDLPTYTGQGIIEKTISEQGKIQQPKKVRILVEKGENLEFNSTNKSNSNLKDLPEGKANIPTGIF